jgi:histidinol dehydrogenase
MKTITDLATARAFLSERSTVELAEASPSMKQKIRDIFGEDLTPEEAVRRIVSEVRAKGDQALFDFIKRIDGMGLAKLEVGKIEISEAYKKVDKELVSALKLAAERIEAFHRTQKGKLGLDFVEGGMGFIVRPLERVGVYIPGGRAYYPSTVLMTVIPARVAGVTDVFITTPPAPDGDIPAPTLVAADIAGVSRVFKVGGVQAIAALAYGTKSIPRVDKICGPGNIFVMLAKRLVYGAVAIDGLHGPTETVIIADGSANASFCAADLLAQAEHDEMASAVLITTSSRLADAVSAEVKNQLAKLERRAIARLSLEHNGAIIVVPSLDEAINLVNSYAPEHLCLMVKNARSYLDRIRNAGGIFIGVPEAIGDYTAGPSHVMPTGRTARFSSPLSVLDFLKVSILVDMDEKALKALGPASVIIARAEGLTAHSLSVEIRLAEAKGEPGRW